MAERWIPRSASRASTAARGYPASFFIRENRSSDAQPTMAPSRSTAAVAQWVSLIPRTIIRDDDSSKQRADENPAVLGLADDQREGGSLDQDRQSAGGGEGRRHSDALNQSTENDEERCEGEQPEEEAPKHLDRGGRSLEVVGEHGQDGGIERKRRQKTGEPRTHRGCQTREQQHEAGRHRHSRRNVPSREPRSARGSRPSRHQAERQRERQDRGREEPDEREGDVLERDGRRAEREAARPEGRSEERRVGKECRSR